MPIGCHQLAPVPPAETLIKDTPHIKPGVASNKEEEPEGRSNGLDKALNAKI